MIAVVRPLASLRLTLAGMVLLAIGAALSYGNPDHMPVWVLVAPMAVLAVNLLAAVLTNPRINRRGGLLVFHLALLGIVTLAAAGLLSRFEAHVEMLEGQTFSAPELFNVKQGPLHDEESLDKLVFMQGAYTVEYRPGMVRGLTHSQVRVADGAGGWEERTVGDDRPLVLDGYRFYTSFNKGFAPVLTWLPDQGAPQTGAVHMPSYPLFEFKQDNSWNPPGGPAIRFWLRLDTGLREDAAWTLDGRKSQGVLVVNSGEERVELAPGETVRLAGGNLHYERLSTWMGYKIYYDPTLRGLFFTAIIGVLGLSAHYWRKFGARATPARSLPDLGDRSEQGGKARPVFRSFEENSRSPFLYTKGTRRIGKMDRCPTGAVDQSQVRQAPGASAVKAAPPARSLGEV